MVSLITTLLPIASKILDKVIPNKAAKEAALMELQIKLTEHEGELVKALVQSDVAQAEINKIEAQDKSLFKSGWRPGMAWLCVIGFAWNIFLPVVVWGIRLAGYSAPDVPNIGGDMLMSMTFGLLGLGAYRTYEKKNSLTK